MIKLSLLQELQELKKKSSIELASAKDDYLLAKLTDYHIRLSSDAENFSTERLSPEVQTLKSYTHSYVTQSLQKFHGIC